ncbi:U-scoloptoxin(20)-Cw1a-like [Uloborus diversus]|uniref:U-scoloptoxin(20)-Cw1a-like n=1 Tax=Uloborus diversus TaxID=327109 RepID=UPI00240A4ED2|nr:U-scoloptoxin(20)-Cw1a-like [Uloborus diversus]
MARRDITQTVEILVLGMMMLLAVLPPAHVLSLACNACGPECANACGTAMFRACCFNYNRKRSLPLTPEAAPPPVAFWLQLLSDAQQRQQDQPENYTL